MVKKSNEFSREKIGRIVSANLERIIIRKLTKRDVEIGEIVYVPLSSKIILYEVYEIEHKSVLDAKDIETSAYLLEFESNATIFDREERYYMLIYAKPLVELSRSGWSFVKIIPPIFGEVYSIDERVGKKIREVIEEGVEIGKLRSGSKVLDISLPFNIEEALSHHILIAATTGRGKSNLLKVLLWKILENENIGMIVMDPHDEYISPSSPTLIKHPNALRKLICYSPVKKEYFSNSMQLCIDISLLRPSHFIGVFNFTEPQIQCLYLAYQYGGQDWIKKLIEGDDNLRVTLIKQRNVHPETYDVLRRKIIFYLNISLNLDDKGKEVAVYHSIFKSGFGGSFINDVLESLEKGYVIVFDTSELTASEELLLMSMISHAVFERYKYYKKKGVLEQKAKVGIVLEEAPRVLNSSLLANDGNIFGAIAREGRKFNIGLIAVTQLPSLIPHEILSNINTKIILGIEMQKERNVIISSAPQDLTLHAKIISSLNKGEAIITSIFVPFPLPLKIYSFEDICKTPSLQSMSAYRGIINDDEV